MREADLHVPPSAIEAMGFDAPPDGFREAEVRDVTLLSCEGATSLTVTAYSEPVDDALDDAGFVEWWERLDDGGDGATYLARVAAPALPEETPAPGDRGVTIRSVTPEDGGCTLTVVGSQDAIRRQFESADGPAGEVRVSLRRLGAYRGTGGVTDGLTERQLEVLEAAFDLGYYEVPREATADEVARRLDLDRSTVTEHLQRAERNLVAAALRE